MEDESNKGIVSQKDLLCNILEPQGLVRPVWHIQNVMDAFLKIWLPAKWTPQHGFHLMNYAYEVFSRPTNQFNRQLYPQDTSVLFLEKPAMPMYPRNAAGHEWVGGAQRSNFPKVYTKGLFDTPLTTDSDSDHGLGPKSGCLTRNNTRLFDTPLAPEIIKECELGVDSFVGTHEYLAPTPTTLIFADSIELKEQHTAERRRGRDLAESHAFKKKGESGRHVEIEEEEDGSWVTLVAN
ncbi:hypothetical protein LXL04_022942 [Taraxacum kok-saghyz]